MSTTPSASRHNAEDHGADPSLKPIGQQRGRVGRSVVKLALAGVALVALILILGDFRRKAAPLSHAAAYATQLATRLGETRTLPLNLEFAVPNDIEPVGYTFDHLSREEARVLRRRKEEIIVAYTRVIRNVLMPNGRATVVFHDGTFEPVWMPVEQFDETWTAQQETVNQAPP
ncbi:MAG: hypothetical protein ACE5E5_01795 [Phycisphaerae bacterium]